MTTGKSIVLIRWTFIGKVMSLLFNMLSRLIITILPRSKCLLISWLQSPSAVIKSDTVSNVSSSICHEMMGQDAMILVFWMLSFKPTFSLSSFTFIKRFFSSSSLSAIRVVSFVIYFMCRLSSVYSSPNLPVHHPHPVSPSCYPYIFSLHLCLYFCFVNKIFYTIFRFHLYALIYNICFSISDFMTVSRSIISLQMVQLHSFW